MVVFVGQHQFHLLVKENHADVIEGRIGLVIKNINSLKRRLGEVQSLLAETKFSFHVVDSYTVDVTCPWGNHFRVHAHRPGEETNPEHPNFPSGFGLSYLELDCRPGTVTDIACFYKMRTGAITADASHRYAGTHAVDIVAGARQRISYVEKHGAESKCLDWHIGLYVANFSELYRSLEDDVLIFKDVEEQEICKSVDEALGDYQLRFRDIISGGAGDAQCTHVVFRLQHEVRSLFHEMFGRTLINPVE